MALDDYITANDISQLSNTLGAVNAINDSNSAEGRRKETYARQNTERKDTEAALGAMQMGGEVPDNLTSSSVYAAKVKYANQLQADSVISDLDLQGKTDASYFEMLTNKNQSDLPDGEYMRNTKPETDYEMAAFIRLSGDLEKNKKFLYEDMQYSKKMAAIQVQRFQGKMALAKEYVKMGNHGLAENEVMSAINKNPHQLDCVKNDHGNFDVFFTDDDGKRQPLQQGANQTLDQLIAIVESVPPKQMGAIFASEMVRAKTANRKAKPETWINKKGEALTIYHLADPHNSSAPQTLIYEKGGGELAGMTMEMVRTEGFEPAPSTESRIKGMTARAKLATANANLITATNKNKKGGAMDLGEKTKALNHLLRPFANDPMGKSSYQAAQQFIKDHAGKRDISQGDAKLLGQAKQAIALNDDMNTSIGGQSVPVPEVNPSQGGIDAYTSGGQPALKEYLDTITDRATRKTVYEAVKAHAEGLDKAGQTETATPGAMDLPGKTETPGAIDDTYGVDYGNSATEDNWNNSFLGKTESAVKNLPGAMAASERANEEGYAALKQGKTGSSIPGVGSFKRQRYGNRADGTPKGPGFFGELQTKDGKVATEISIGVEFDGKKVEIPLLVPTLSQEEINMVLQGGNPPDGVIKKAVAHAKMRIAQDKSPFAGESEQVDKFATK